MKKLIALIAWIALMASLSCLARDLPYDEAADVKGQVSQALKEAQAAHVPVLLIFGANWCEDCRALDQSLKKGHNAALLSKEFKVVKIDVGNFDKNLDVVNRYGNPIKAGIPAAVILSPDNQILYATKAGELADARRMNDESIERFFSQAASQAKALK